MKKKCKRKDRYAGLEKCCLKMKFLVLFMLIAVFQVSAEVKSQETSLSIKMTNVSLVDVLKQIESQSDYTCLYSHSDVAKITNLTIALENVPIEKILDVCLKGTKLGYKIVDRTIVIRNLNETVQKKDDVKGKTITGRVTDVRKESLPGVSVLVKGTTLGVVTDVNGKFKISLPVEQKNIFLIFSFIGMKSQTIQVTTQDSLNVVLEEDLQELDEVTISTGYYKVDKRQLTSSVTTLKMDDIMQPGVSTLDQMLEGRVPGMIFMQNSGQVGAAPKIKIRGTTTLLGSTSPLWVLDEVILNDPVNVDPASINDLDFVNLLGNSISGLNPEDIEKIDVLKDASATALYGPRASNGVIVITTKKGKVGAPSVSYSLTGTYRRRPRYTDRAVRVMNSQERVDYSRELIRKKLKVPSTDSHVGYEAIYEDYVKGIISYDDFAEKVYDMETANTDWLGLIMRDTYSHAHTLSISGGSDNTRYYTSLGMTDEIGNLRGESNKRYNVMTKVDVNYKKFSMTFSLNGNQQKRDYTPEEVGLTDYAYNTARSVQAYNRSGNLMFYQRGDENGKYDKPFSILFERENTDDNIKTMSFGASVRLAYRFLPVLSADMQFSYNLSNTEQRTHFGEKSWYAANLRKNYTDAYRQSEIDKSGDEDDDPGEIDENSMLPKGGELRINDTKNENYNFRASVKYNRFLDLEENHQFSASVIGELSSSLYTGHKVTKRGYLPDRGMIFDNVNMIDGYYVPFQKYDNWLKTDANSKGVLSHNLTRLVGLIGTLFYSYKNVYILNANARIDGSNKFGTKSNDKLNPIWSVSGRWNMHENILYGVSWVNTLALKMSFGYQGNMSAQDSPELIIQKFGTHSFFNEYYSKIKYYPNPNLKWEKTATYNADLEFALFNQKLVGNVSAYYRHTEDAFLKKTVSTINGIDSYTVNRGTLNNFGFEFTFNFVPINTFLNKASIGGKRKGFIWRFDPNFGSVFNQLVDKVKPKDKVLQDEITYSDYLNGKVQVAGRPVNTFYSYKYTGLSHEDGRPTFYGINADEIVGKDAYGNDMTRKKMYETMILSDVYMEVMEHSGCREPFLQGSISNYLGWNNWGLSFSLAYSIGAKVRLLKMYANSSTLAANPEKNMRKEFVHRWQRPGDELITDIPGLLESKAFDETLTPWWNDQPYKFAGNIWNMYDNSNLRVVSNDYLKLTSASLRYVVPDELCRKLCLRSAYISISGTNLFTICRKELRGQDPSQSGSSALINISVRPTYSLKLNVTF